MRIAIYAILIVLAYFSYTEYEKRKSGSASLPSLLLSEPRERTVNVGKSQKYQCDGRTHCSQMTSCAEAKFFLQNCPSTKMDGDGDGIPCERQLCN